MVDNIKIQGRHPLTGEHLYYFYGHPSENRAKIIMYNHLTDSCWFSYNAGLTWEEIPRFFPVWDEWLKKADIEFFPKRLSKDYTCSVCGCLVAVNST